MKRKHGGVLPESIDKSDLLAGGPGGGGASAVQGGTPAPKRPRLYHVLKEKERGGEREGDEGKGKGVPVSVGGHKSNIHSEGKRTSHGGGGGGGGGSNAHHSSNVNEKKNHGGGRASITRAGFEGKKVGFLNKKDKK